MEPRFDPTIGEYIWPTWDSRPQIPPIFDVPFKLPTIKVAVFQGVLMIAFMVAAIIFKTKHSTLDGQCSNLTVLLFAQVALWMISFIIHHYYSNNHAILRMAGFNTFSAGFNRRSSYLFYILTCSNAFTLLYVAASIKYASSVICDWKCSHSALNLTIYTILVQGVLFLIATFNYVRKVNFFNYMNPVPETVAAQGLSMATEVVLEEARNEMLRRFITQQSFQIDFYRNLILEMNRSTGHSNPLGSQPRVPEFLVDLVSSLVHSDDPQRRRSFQSIYETI